MAFPWSVSSKPLDKALDVSRHVPSPAVHEGLASDFRAEHGETLGTPELGRRLEATCRSQIDPMRLGSTPHDRDLPQELPISQPLTDDDCGCHCRLDVVEEEGSIVVRKQQGYGVQPNPKN